MAVSFALIQFDGFRLLLPQAEVGIIEVAANIVDEESVPNASGVVKSGNKTWPVFALDAEMQLRSDNPESYKYNLCMNHDDEAAFSIACEQVSTISFENNNELKPVPASMQVSGCPVDFLVMKDFQMMMGSSAEKMLQYLIPETTEE